VNETIRVLLVDDQALMRMGFSMVLSGADGIDVVGEAADGATAVRMAAELTPDVVLMDVRMPGMDGIEATRRIAADCPDTRVLVLTTFDLDEYAFAALRAGASGFLLKDAEPAQLVSAIRAVAAGEATLAPRVTRRMLELFSPALPVAAGAAPEATSVASGGTGEEAGGDAAQALATLTPRETEVLRAMAEGLSNAEIAQRLVLSETTVKTHVGNILAKLGKRDRVQAVVLAYTSGFMSR
jgi:DNA-binding NarL/FixJ family response regulator